MSLGAVTVAHWFEQASSSLRRGDARGAIELLKRLLGSEPEHAQAHALLALALVQAKRVHAALHEAQQAVAIEPEVSFCHYALGRTLVVHGRLEAARVEFEMARTFDPEDADNELGLALVAEFAGNRADELQHLERALSLAPDNATVLSRLADIWFRRGDDQQAERYAREALEQEPDHLDALVVMGHLLLRRGQTEEAREHAFWALSNDATSVTALGLLVAVKTRTNLLLGLWWRMNTFLLRGGKNRAIVFLIGGYVLTRVASLYTHQHGFSLASQCIDYAWLALCVYSWVGPPYFARQLQRELSQVQLSKDY